MYNRKYFVLLHYQEFRYQGFQSIKVPIKHIYIQSITILTIVLFTS